MASTKEYRDFILEQLSEAPNITCRPMMGEFLLYSNNVLFGGIYDDRLLVKIVPENEHYKMSESISYDGAKPMYFVEDVDNTRQKGHVIPRTFKTMQVFEDAGFKLKEIIMKEQHNCRATGYWKTNSVKYNFLLLAYEYLFVFKK